MFRRILAGALAHKKLRGGPGNVAALPPGGVSPAAERLDAAAPVTRQEACRVVADARRLLALR